ncbi:hypothetical protein LJB82_02905 [Desulfovibrio sp. OttesenSCG-928-M16]|nr:hypothetical protein [Desulfovibrio sp. OttesenSCG-928-M16]
MIRFKHHAACLLAIMSILAAAPEIASAAGIALNNDMELDIKAVYCVDETGATKQVIDALQAESSATVAPDKFPEYECNRISVLTKDGKAWQFYHEPEPGAATSIIFSMDKVNPNRLESYPSLLIESGDETYISPAGVPLSFLLQAMSFGLEEAKWKEANTPEADSSKNPGEFAISFAGVSWNFAGNGLLFAELVPGKQLAESFKMTSPFTGPMLMAMFEELQNSGATPWALSFNENKTALTEEGKNILPDATLAGNATSEESRWEAVSNMLEAVLESDATDMPRLVFGNEAIIFDMVLNRDDGVTEITITRRKDAAFG